MILVEPRVFESMQQAPPVSDATSKNLREKDQSMQGILESDQNNYDKANAYQQALWGFLNRFEKYKDRPLGQVQLTRDPKRKESTSEDSGEVDDGIERDVFASVPKSMKNKAERLLQRLKSNPDVKWNDLGEFEYRGQLIKNSNLTDLVNDVLRKRKNTTEPLGWETFAEALQRINVPQDLVGNPSLWSYMHKKDWSAAIPENVASTLVKPAKHQSLDESFVAETPRKWKRSERKRKKLDQKWESL